MNLFFLLLVSLAILSRYTHGLPTLKTALSGMDQDNNVKMMLLDDAIKSPLGLLKGDHVDQVKSGIDVDNDNDLDDDNNDNSGSDKETSSSSSSSVSIRLDSKDSYCLFLPPEPGLDVAATETDGTPFCTSKSDNHQYPTLPSGLIVSSHYESTADYVQVTGKMNADAYHLGPQDGGGQYDNRDVRDVECNGYQYFVSLLEPDVNRYCIRCCRNESDCPVGKSGYGCTSIIPDGIYD